MGAGLLAKAVGQATHLCLTDRIREQARSHMGSALAIRLRCQAQVRLHGTIPLRKALLDLVLILERRHDHHLITVLPVGRRGDFVVVRQLQRINDPQDFMEVTPGARRIGNGQADLLVRIDHEQRA